MNLAKLIHENINSDVVTIDLVNSILTGKSDEAKKQIIKRANQKGELVRVKNGLYVIGKDFRNHGVELFSVANYMILPSYISLESALSYYSLIPETVYTTTSVTTKSSKEHQNDFGIFSFSHLKHNHFNFGFYQKIESAGPFLIATPLKALTDYIYLRNKNYDSLKAIEDDLRFNWHQFLEYKECVNKEKIQEFKAQYKGYRMKKILNEIGKIL